jgi:hypothetical protein
MQKNVPHFDDPHPSKRMQPRSQEISISSGPVNSLYSVPAIAPSFEPARVKGPRVYVNSDNVSFPGACSATVALQPGKGVHVGR